MLEFKEVDTAEDGDNLNHKHVNHNKEDIQIDLISVRD